MRTRGTFGKALSSEGGRGTLAVMPEPRSSAPCLRPRLCTGSRGSLVLAVASEEPEALRAQIEDFRDGFRKVWFDLSAGFAEFMSPSQAHEFTARDVRDVVMALCHAEGIDVVDMGSTSVRTPDGEAGGDPDESFLVGERATRYREVEAERGTDAADASIEGEPPDIAVEVEHTSRRDEKALIYRECGVGELWDIGTPRVGAVSVIHDLQTGDRPRRLAPSRYLPDVQAARLPDAIAALKGLGGPYVFMARHGRGEPVARTLLAALRGTPDPAPHAL